jgi:hypothetical protein
LLDSLLSTFKLLLLKKSAHMYRIFWVTRLNSGWAQDIWA